MIEIKVKPMATYSENKGENKHLSNSSFLLDKSHKKKSLSLSADMREITRLWRVEGSNPYILYNIENWGIPQD